MGKISKSVKGLIGLSTLGAVGLKGYKDLDEIKEEGLKEYLKGEAEELKKKGVIDYGRDEYKEFEELKDKLIKNPSITSIKEQSIKYPNIIKETIIKENVTPEDKIYEEIIESNFSKLKDYGYEKMNRINNFRNQFNFSYENWKKRQLIKNLGIGAAGATAATGLGYLVHQPAIGKFKELHKKFTDWQEQNAKDKAAQEAWDNLTPAEQQAIKNIENEKHQKQVADAEAKFRAQDQNIEGGEELAGTGIDTSDIAAAAFFSQKDLDYYWDKLKNFNRGGH